LTGRDQYTDDLSEHMLTCDYSCICHGTLDWDYLPNTTPAVAIADEPDYSRFENFIPRSAQMGQINQSHC
jgi:hypothetical protein